MAPNRRRIGAALAAVVCVSLLATPVRAETGPPPGSWLWPVEGPVLRGFEPPPTPFSPGHRGIDIGAAFGTPVHAPADGVVTFAGWVAGSLFVTIDHGDGYRSTDSWLAQALVREGQSVHAGDVVALSGRGHPELPDPQLHFGVRLNGEYVDPLPLLRRRSAVDLIRLAPLDESSQQRAPALREGVELSAIPDVSVAYALGARLPADSATPEDVRGRSGARGPPEDEGRHLE